MERSDIPVLFKVLIPIVLGVVYAFYTNCQIEWYWPVGVWFVLLVLINSMLGVRIAVDFLFGGIVIPCFFLLGCFLVTINKHDTHPDYFAYKSEIGVFQVEVLEVPEVKAKSLKCYVNVCQVNQETSIGKALVYFQKSEKSMELRYGDILLVETSFTPVKPNGNPNEFDYARYLKIHNVKHQAYVSNENWERVGNGGSSFFSGLFDLRIYLNGLLAKAGLKDENLMVAQALILGQKSSLDRETLRTYSSAGAMHVLAVSGLHVGIVMLLFSFLFAPLKQLPQGGILFIVALLAVIWFYALITGFSSSVLRAAVMFSFVVVGKEIERDTSIYQSVLVSAFLLILIEPLVLFQVGFQLSYLAVLGIVFLQPRIYNLFYSKYWLVDKVWQITSVSLAAQLATFPLGLYYFHQFPNFFMVSNLIVIPLAFAILLAGLCYFVTFWIPLIGELVFYVLDGLLSVLNFGVKWVESLPYSIYWGVSIRWFEVFILYAVLFLLSWAFIYRRKRALITAMVGAVFLLIYNIYERHKLYTSNELVVYNVNNALAVDVFYGSANLFIADSSLIKDEDKLLFHVKHNWFYHTGSEQASRELVFDYQEDRLLKAGEESMFFLTHQLPDSIPITDYYYLQSIQYIPDSLIDMIALNRSVLIIGDNVGWGAQEKINAKIPENLVHDLTREGSFAFTFQ